MYEGDELSKGKPLTLTFFQCGEVLSMIQPEEDHGTGLTGTICGVLGPRGLPGNQLKGGFWWHISLRHKGRRKTKTSTNNIKKHDSYSTYSLVHSSGSRDFAN